MQVLKQNIINLYGEKGRQWLDDLPQLIMQAQATYGLSNLRSVKNLSYNYVLSGLQNTRPIILKLGLDIDEFKHEAAALVAFENFGGIKVLAENAGLLLLECTVPGTSLKSYFPERDDEAIEITAHVIKRLHKAPMPYTHAFPHIKDWLGELDKDLKIPTKYLQKAQKLRDQLLKTTEPDVLLHGDLHHDNILQHGADWIVIDPKGVIGESTYEIAAFIRNPMPELLMNDNASNVVLNRITRFAKILELSERRIIDWCFVQAVLAWVWAQEDGCDDSYFKNLTEFFERYL